MKIGQPVIIASNNLAKTNELITCFQSVGMQAISYQKLLSPVTFPAEGTQSYLLNARTKAHFLADYLPDEWIVADDSGMKLTALSEKLGVMTARQLGSFKDDHELNNKILSLVAGKDRTVKMISQLVLVTPDNREFDASGIFRGTIAMNERGANGSSFDLILVPRGMDQTLAQLPDKIKLPLLHRTNAIKQLINKV